MRRTSYLGGPGSNSPGSFYAAVFPRTFLVRLSEKSHRRSQRSLTGRQGGAFGPFCAPYSGQILARTVARTLFGQSQKGYSRKLRFRIAPLIGYSGAEVALI